MTSSYNSATEKVNVNDQLHCDDSLWRGRNSGLTEKRDLSGNLIYGRTA